MMRERARDVANDPRSIVPEQFETNGAIRARFRLAALLNDDGESNCLEFRQLGDQRISAIALDGEAQQSGELAAEARHAALLPVRAGRKNLIGQLLNDTGLVIADDGQNQRGSHARSPREKGLDCTSR